MKLLARHPQSQHRLREESMTYGLHEREMDYDDLLVEKMPCESPEHERSTKYSER